MLRSHIAKTKLNSQGLVVSKRPEWEALFQWVLHTYVARCPIESVCVWVETTLLIWTQTVNPQMRTST